MHLLVTEQFIRQAVLLVKRNDMKTKSGRDYILIREVDGLYEVHSFPEI